MKTMILAGIGAIAVAMQPALAADMPVKAPIVKAPPLMYNWSGFYIGGHIGMGWGDKDQTTPGFVIGGVAVVPQPSGFDISGGLAGGQIGFNYQAGPSFLGGNWVVGLEADASWSDVRGRGGCAAQAGLVLLAGVCSAKVDSLGTAALRFGTAFDNTLIYAKVGAAWAQDKYANIPLAGGLPFTRLDGSETRWGWMVGVGAEFAVIGNWTAKVEYNYLDLGTERVSSTSTPAGLILNSDVEQRVQTFKLGLNYRFGWAPVSGRY